MNGQLKDEEMEMVHHMEAWLKKWKLKQKWATLLFTFCLAQITMVDNICVGEHMGEKGSRHCQWAWKLAQPLQGRFGL